MPKTEIICNCTQITLQEILDAISAGATSFPLLQEVTGVSTGCGRCANRVKAIVEAK